MIIENLVAVKWSVEEQMGPDGPQRVLVLIDQPEPLTQPVRVTRVPFSAAVAKQVAAKLSGLVVAGQIPQANGRGPV